MAKPDGPICVPCAVPMYPVKNGATVCLNASFGPYEIYRADIWGCGLCGHEVIVGFGSEPIAQHFEPEFAGVLERVTYHVKP